MSATNRGAVRLPQDAYDTPALAVDLILPEILWCDWAKFCEPCRGNGVIYDRVPLPEDRKHWFEIREGRDYLQGDLPEVDLVLTNPPFSLAQEFLDRALSHAQTVVLLLRLNFLGAQKRRDWWQERLPTHLLALSTRPSFTGEGTDATDYAWFAWDRGGWLKRRPGIYVL